MQILNNFKISQFQKLPEKQNIKCVGDIPKQIEENLNIVICE